MRAHAMWAALALLSAEPPPARSEPPPRSELPELLARCDAAWAERDRPESMAASQAALAEAAALAPDEYGVLWRQARADAWLADDTALGRDERGRIGKHGWDLAERAIQKGPARVEGYLYAVLTMGNYALSLGVLRALRDGIEAKFRSRLVRAEAIDPRYLDGTVQIAWGRYWYKLPWPRYDARRSEESFRKALRVNPASVRARVYLAELYLKEDKQAPAKNLLVDALAGEPGAYDAPEERRMQARARELLSNLERNGGGDP